MEWANCHGWRGVWSEQFVTAKICLASGKDIPVEERGQSKYWITCWSDSQPPRGWWAATVAWPSRWWWCLISVSCQTLLPPVTSSSWSHTIILLIHPHHDICPEITLCGWQDIKIQLLTNTSCEHVSVILSIFRFLLYIFFCFGGGRNILHFIHGIT